MKFFEERSEQSEVKAQIVQKYFKAWSNIVVGATKTYGGGKIAYIDLYAGPGRYKDGAASTPLLVVQEALKNERVTDAFVGLFNDADKNNSGTLDGELKKISGIEKIDYAIGSSTVQADFEKYFSDTKIIPSFTFLDPFGYVGLSLKLVNGVIKDWGCDCVFFFNYNRINMGISNPAVTEHMNALFGNERADVLRARVTAASPAQRETMVLEAMTEAIHEMGAKYVLPFRFRKDTGRLSHHLIFVSKHFKGYEVMKDIMSSESSSHEQGVASFAYSVADESMPLLFELQRPIDDLAKMLVNEYAGKTLTFTAIYHMHSVGRPYLKKHYKEVLRKLEDDGKLTVSDPLNKTRRKGTLADRLVIHFGENSDG